MEKIKLVLIGGLLISLITNFFIETQEAGFINFLLLFMWILVVLSYKLSYVVSVRIGLLGLVVTALLLAINNRDLAEKIAILSYVLFVVGFVQSLYETRHSI